MLNNPPTRMVLYLGDVLNQPCTTFDWLRSNISIYIYRGQTSHGPESVWLMVKLFASPLLQQTPRIQNYGTLGVNQKLRQVKMSGTSNECEPTRVFGRMDERNAVSLWWRKRLEPAFNILTFGVQRVVTVNDSGGVNILSIYCRSSLRPQGCCWTI